MNHRTRTSRFARMALIVSLSLTAACATVTTAPVEEKAGPQAPGVGFNAESPTPEAAPAAVTPPSTPPQSPGVETTSAPPNVPVSGRITPRQKYVNVRPAPSTDNRPVAVLMGGKKVEVLAEEGTWVKIRWTRGKKVFEGWVVTKFVEKPE
ncbi:MAG: SH3 domain-containing protein [Desulfuromonadales bacterium]|nr:MAG: SH3 domain-containing protein [Desulfuromonadales bacterium]